MALFEEEPTFFIASTVLPFLTALYFNDPLSYLAYVLLTALLDRFEGSVTSLTRNVVSEMKEASRSFASSGPIGINSFLALLCTLANATQQSISINGGETKDVGFVTEVPDFGYSYLYPDGTPYPLGFQLVKN